MKIIDQTSKTNWKFLAIVVVFGLVVSSGIVWYANLPTPASQPIEMPTIKKLQKDQPIDTSTWQTYRNEEFGFEVRYPSSAQEERGDNWFLALYPTDRYDVLVSWVIRQDGLQQYLDEVDKIRTKAYEGDPSVIVQKRYSIMVQGASAIQQEIILVAAPLPEIETLIEKMPGIIITIEVRGNENEGFTEKLRSFNNQILSTFRFVDSSKVNNDETELVSVATDKQTYRRGEKIVATITNNHDNPIFTRDSKSYCSVIELQQKEGEKWQRIGTCFVGAPPRTVTIDSTSQLLVEIGPKSLFYKELLPNSYRIEFSYRFSQLGNDPLQSVRSKEFIVIQ